MENIEEKVENIEGRVKRIKNFNVYLNEGREKV